ncbi:MAG TPA: outer membrane protein transport protein [Anaeromyxobacteraceae bacterium]|nr:outer membrane protein transport protein [Anaeromyxobacteraceae bacterium]
MHLRKILVAAALAASASPALATNGMRMIGFGPVQNSMGGVGVGATLDSASVLSNPAGMSELGGRVDFGATWFLPTVKYSATGTDTGQPGPNPFVNQPGVTLESNRGASPIPAFGIVIPIDDRWSFGLGAYGVAGMGVDYAANLYSSTTFTGYQQMRFTPGVSFKLNDMFSFGVTLNAMWATTEWNVASAFGQVPHMSGSGFGIGGTVGAKITPIQMLTIGLAFETTSFFQDFAYNTPGGVDKLTFNQPCVLTGGVAVRPLDMLLVAADVEWINWPATNGADKPAFSQNSSGAMPWNMNWSSQVVFKLGVQVTPLDWLAIRAGYNYGKMPLDASRAFENIAFPAVAENHVTLGAGFNLGKHVAINVGGMWAPSASITGSNPNFPFGTPGYPGPYGQGIATYTTSMTQVGLDGGIAYKF